MNTKERERRMKHFPVKGNEQIESVLAVAHGGKSPVNSKTIGAILRGEKNDKHGVFDIFITITDKIENAKKEAISKLALVKN